MYYEYLHNCFTCFKIDDDFSDDELDYEFISQLQGYRTKPTRNQGFLEHTIPNFSDRQFQEHFRLLTTSFERCLEICCPLLKKTCIDGRQGTNEQHQLLSVLWQHQTVFG